MRFRSEMYDKAFPKEEKPKMKSVHIETEDSMVETIDNEDEVVEPVVDEVVEEVEDGNDGYSEPSSE